MRILSTTEETVLACILKEYVPNNENYLQVTYDIFPEYLLINIKKYLDVLETCNFITYYCQTLSDVELYFTEEGIKYFENKKKQLFPLNAIGLLKSLMNTDNPESYMQDLFDGLGQKEDRRLRAMMRKLNDDGYINSSWASNVPYIIEFNEKAYELEENNFQQKCEDSKQVYNFNGNTFNDKVLVNSQDNSSVNKENDVEIFDKMLTIATNIGDSQKDLIISMIEEMRENTETSTFRDKYNAFITTAANHMTLFAPFIPALTMFLK